MPKVKTHSGAKKRFKRTATGKFKFGHVFKRHLLTGRSKKRKRQAPQRCLRAGRASSPDRKAAAVQGLVPCPAQNEDTKLAAVATACLKAAKGFRGKRSSCHAVANEAVQHAWMHMYRSRKVRKRDFRSLWIQRINAAARRSLWRQLLEADRQAQCDRRAAESQDARRDRDQRPGRVSGRSPAHSESLSICS